MKDVKTILEYSISSSKNVHGHDNENTNWHLALHTHHKSFVGHHYYQSVAPVSAAFSYRLFLQELPLGEDHRDPISLGRFLLGLEDDVLSLRPLPLLLPPLHRAD